MTIIHRHIDSQTDEEIRNAVDRLSTKKLHTFRHMFTVIVNQYKDDPRVHRPRRQLKAIVSVLHERLGLPQPTDQTIKLDILSLTAIFDPKV